MIKEKFSRNKPHCNIGIIGHIDHSKLSLMAAVAMVVVNPGKTQKAEPHRPRDLYRQKRKDQPL